MTVLCTKIVIQWNIDTTSSGECSWSWKGLSDMMFAGYEEVQAIYKELHPLAEKWANIKLKVFNTTF